MGGPSVAAWALEIDMRTCNLVLAILIACSHVMSDRVAAAADDERASLSELIEKLANKNKIPPKEGAKAYPIWPRGYDWTEHDRIRDAIKELNARAGEDMAELVNHLGDRRYCATIASPSGAYNDWTVGRVCEYILRVNVEPFQLPGDKRFDSYMPAYSGGDRVKRLQQWWKDRRDKSLMDLQLEAIEHTRDSTKRHLEGADDNAKRNRFREDLEHLEKLKDEIEETGEPIPRGAIHDGFHVPEKHPVQSER